MKSWGEAGSVEGNSVSQYPLWTEVSCGGSLVRSDRVQIGCDLVALWKTCCSKYSGR